MGDIMKEVVWELFKKTGYIKYFLLAKSLEGDNSEDNKFRRNNNK